MQLVISSTENSLKLESLLKNDYRSSLNYTNQRVLDEHVASRALLQKVLIEFYGINYLPEIITLQSGKPCFKEARYPFFNLSNSGKYLALAIGKSEIGIDIEFERKRHNLEGLIKRVCSKKEQVFLLSLDEITMLHEFTRLWTVKECLVKTTGKGLVDVDMLYIDPVENNCGYYNLPSSNQICSTSLNFPFTDKLAYLSFSCNKKTEDGYEFYCIDADGNLVKTEDIRVEKIYENFSLRDLIK
ncbi:4'-phosphopantetheinyl transferase family protein [Succinivibrio faecicola]|uniref:4'-phosphopantetheinyl transferase superfamily protein n=1 Tax=Succinivibrio faecicola TaxID=2820300 RepID=A0ABS7DF33_9GAMM|nr:4'-phosphopantetheinyl transferase superfamily protein [Succinivibrio faecicola]MBW7569908.1 4'-phosphopantetheinyl transferase superfamily protein [Succinivibrio faecicola]